jgi:hypothetical protein
MPRLSPVSSSTYWNLCNYSFGFLHRLVPFHRSIRYEDLVQEPDTQIRQVLDETGFDQLRDLPFIQGQRVQLGTDHTVAGNLMRFRTGMMNLRSDEEWQKKMRPAARRTVTAMTWPLLARYGYFDRRK